MDDNAIQKLIEKNKELESELELFKQKAPLVGVRWYGDGSFMIALSFMIQGLNKIILKGYGDKAAIDLSTWARLKGSEAVQKGILVRDDTVIDELHVPGVIAKHIEDKNPNAFTDDAILSILKNKTKKQLENIIDNCTDHFPLKHFLRVYHRNNLDDPGKMIILDKRYAELFAFHRWSLLDDHDLNIGLEQAGLNWENVSREDKIEALVRKDLE